MKKLVITVILLIGLCGLKPVFSMDHAFGGVLDGDVGYFNASCTIEVAYVSKFAKFFSLQHDLSMGFGDFQMLPGFLIRYSFIPLFLFGKKNAFFTLSAPGLRLGCLLRVHREKVYDDDFEFIDFDYVFVPVFQIGIIERIGGEFKLGKKKEIIFGFFVSINYVFKLGIDYYDDDLYIDFFCNVLSCASGGIGFYVKKKFKSKKKTTNMI